MLENCLSLMDCLILTKREVADGLNFDAGTFLVTVQIGLVIPEGLLVVTQADRAVLLGHKGDINTNLVDYCLNEIKLWKCIRVNVIPIHRQSAD